ncbi:MAG: hypothetical protein ACOY9Y_10450 [Bacillota bacterium]
MPRLQLCLKFGPRDVIHFEAAVRRLEAFGKLQDGIKSSFYKKILVWYEDYLEWEKTGVGKPPRPPRPPVIPDKCHDSVDNALGALAKEEAAKAEKKEGQQDTKPAAPVVLMLSDDDDLKSLDNTWGLRIIN